MKHRGIFILVLLVIFHLTFFTLAYAEGSTPIPGSGFDPSPIADGFRDSSFWVTLLATVIAGALGGVVYELLILQGNVERPHKLTDEELTGRPEYAISKFMFDLGIWARVFIGALAAVAALLVLSPSTTFGLLAMAVIAGSAGISVFRSMQDRLLAAISDKNAADTKAKADRQNDKVDEALAAFGELKNTLATASISPAGGGGLFFAAPPGGAETILDLDDLTKVERLLSEAKGIHQGM